MTTTLPDAAAVNHDVGAEYEHVPTPAELGAAQVVVANKPADVDSAALTTRPVVLTAHAPEAVVST